MARRIHSSRSHRARGPEASGRNRNRADGQTTSAHRSQRVVDGGAHQGKVHPRCWDRTKDMEPKLAQLECTETGGPDSRVHRMHPFTPSSDAEQSSVIRWNLLQGDRLCPVSAGSGHRIPYLPGGRQPPDDSTGWVSYRWTDTGAAQQRTLSTGHSASEPAKGNLET